MIIRRFLAAISIAMLVTPAAFAESSAGCQEAWAATEAAGIAVSHGVMGGIVTIVVDMPSWDAMNYNAKSGLADTYNCAMLGPGGSFGAIEFVSSMTNNRVGWVESGNGLAVLER